MTVSIGIQQEQTSAPKHQTARLREIQSLHCVKQAVAYDVVPWYASYR